MSTQSDQNPRAAYLSRLNDRRAALASLKRRDDWIANSRLAVFVLFGLLLWAVIARDWSGMWLIVPAAGFLALVIVHEQTRRRTTRMERAIAFYEAALRRIDGTWMGTGYGGSELQPDGHLYAADLDLFGKGSMFELLCTARTRAGRQTLAEWLCNPADVETVQRRQEAVTELRSRLDLREELALEGDDIRASVRASLLREWVNAPPAFSQAWIRPVAFVLPTAAVAAGAYWLATGIGVPFLVLVVAEVLLLSRLKTPMQNVVHNLDEPSAELGILVHVISRLERETFDSPYLQGLVDRLRTNGIPASRAIRHLDRLIRLLEMQGNMLFAPVAIVLLWAIHFIVAIERWRASYGSHVLDWLDAVGELEALSALAAYAYEHPGDVFPEFVDHEPYLRGEALGHPLLPEDRCVRNSVELGHPTRILVISGSNMSGKSTLLRTVGINAVLAQAGAPVRAASLRMSPFNIGATLRIVDSIQEGASRFYAEIQRLKHIVDLTRDDTPLLFLMDEILHGTNSHDRTVGAEALMRMLLDANAIGFITTHDLAITASAEALAPRAVNKHFEDQFDSGALTFDYVLRPGVVRKSNALQLMRSVGLDVPDA